MSDALTDAERVTATCGTLLTGDALDMLIADAHRLIEKVLGGAGLDNDTLEAIERWYACHLCWTVDSTLRVKSNSTGSGSYTLEGENRFLAMAVKLDPTGLLQGHLSPQSFRPIFRAAKTTRVPAKVLVGGME